MGMADALFDKIGSDRLRAVVVDFYRRVFDDVMIGFLFIGKNRQRLIDMECSFTARFLGSNTAYLGKPMREAHKNTPIMGGHFDRRLQILRETLRDHEVDTEVYNSWIEHQIRLRSQVTTDAVSECTDTGLKRLLVVDDGPS